jgi:hypothetical protein
MGRSTMLRLRDLSDCSTVHHTENDAKICDLENQGWDIGLCPPYLYQSAYKIGKTTETTMLHVITHIQEGVEKGKLHLSFSRQWRSFWQHFSWHNKGCQIAQAWRYTKGMDWLPAGWQKNYSHRRNTGRVCGHVLSMRGILLQHSCEAWL